MAALIEISIDGEVFSLKENNTNLKTITDQTLVTLGGPLVLDGEHKDALGTLTSAPETWYARDRNGRMTARIRFAWEMSLYLMTEILVPKKTLPIIESKNDILAKFGLAIGSVYDIRRSHQYPRSSDIHDPCDRNELV